MIPSITWLRQYRGEWLRPDLTAGLTAAAVVLPKAMAYATVAGLPVQVGLYTAFVPPIVYAALGRSAVLSVSTTTTIAILVGSALSEAVPGVDAAGLATAAATLTVLVGLVLLVAAALRFGFVANFISEPVLAGFKAGVGAVIVADQIPKLLGFHIHKVGFFRDLVAHRAGRGRDVGADPSRVGGGGGRDPGTEAVAPAGPRRPRGRRPVRRRSRPVLPAGARRGDHRLHPGRAPLAAAARPRPPRGSLAGGGRHRAHELHRDDRE